MPTLVSVFGVEPHRIGGTETFARELSVQLGKLGWKSVLCFLSEPTAEVRGFLELSNVSIEVYAKASDGGYKIGKNLAGILRKHRPEIMHLHYLGFINLYSWIARLHSVKQIFFTDHHSRQSGYISARAPFWKRNLARLVIGPLTKVICVSNYGHKCMSSFGLLPRDRFQMIYNGVDVSRVKAEPQLGLDFRQRYSIPAERKIVTQVSWIIPEKGIRDFLEMARLVTRQERNVHFVVVGDGAYREQYTKEAVELGIDDRLTWTGMVQDPFGEGVFEAADVVCQFSRWEEVFGWMIAEGMAHGKPVVATRVGGIPELVDDGKSGYLVDRADTKAMSEKVLAILNDMELAHRMGSAGREIVSEKFDLKQNVAKLVGAYRLEELGSAVEKVPVGQLQETLS